jgi:hypothetical protein
MRVFPIPVVIYGFTTHTLTEALGDEVELVYIGFSREQWFPGQHLQEEASYGPDVYGSAVAGVPDQQLWSPVPPGGHIVGVRLTRGSWRDKFGITQDLLPRLTPPYTT